MFGVGSGRFDYLTCHKSENKKGHNFHHDPNHLYEHFVQCINGSYNRAFLIILEPCHNYAEEDGEEDNLEHLHVAEGFKYVLGNHVH